jgi:predicted Fe-S protein YdhL (DUF1289 family)
MALGQHRIGWLTHRHRRQASSYRKALCREVVMSSTKDPCISLCKFSDDICVGCGRSKREIRAWKKLDKVDKRAVLAEAELRLIALGATGRRKSK